MKERLYFNEPPPNLTKTWSYSEFLADKKIDYAQLYCRGQSLDKVCPDY